MRKSRALALQAKAFTDMEARVGRMELLLKRMDKKLNSLVNANKPKKAESKPEPETKAKEKAKTPAKKSATK